MSKNVQAQIKALRWSVSLCVAAANLFAIAPALAQTAPADESADADSADIVVTAQKREQKLRDVGIAVSVLNAEEVARFNISSATDVVRAIPNICPPSAFNRQTGLVK